MDAQKLSGGYLSKEEARTYCSLSLRSIDYAKERGELPFIKYGKRVLFKRSDLDGWLEKHRSGADLDAVVDSVLADLGMGK